MPGWVASGLLSLRLRVLCHGHAQAHGIGPWPSATRALLRNFAAIHGDSADWVPWLISVLPQLCALFGNTECGSLKGIVLVEFLLLHLVRSEELGKCNFDRFAAPQPGALGSIWANVWLLHLVSSEVLEKCSLGCFLAPPPGALGRAGQVQL